MAFQEKSFESFNERDVVQAWIYTPIRKPIGIIQIVHGYHEHSRRYMHMILKLNEAGFVVAADDHVGHGKTAYVSNNWSDWGDKGYITMVEDEHSLRKIVQEQYPDLPYFIFGHSMGSMIARCYSTIYGDGIKGLILCGTSGVIPTVSSVIPAFKSLIDEGKGEEVDSSCLEMLNGWMWKTTRYEENPVTANNWACSNPDVNADHARDIYSDLLMPPNIRSLYYFANMMNDIVGTKWAEKVPTQIKVYNIAGDKDPVGLYGEGVYAVSNWLVETGHKVKTKIYSGYSHEIQYYPDIMDEVEVGVIDFMNSIIEK